MSIVGITVGKSGFQIYLGKESLEISKYSLLPQAHLSHSRVLLWDIVTTLTRSEWSTPSALVLCTSHLRDEQCAIVQCFPSLDRRVKLGPFAGAVPSCMAVS